MARREVDRNLLFGVFALHNNLITREDLVAAFSTWVSDKAKPLDRILIDQNRLTPDDHALIESLVRRHLRKHGDDPERSLAALGSAGPALEVLAHLLDPELTASLDSGGRKRDAVTGASTDSRPNLDGSRYRIVRPHAQGNLGRVSIALDAELRREVALKEIQPHLADDPGSRARFLLEAEVTGRLEHPGVVPVHGLGTDRDGRPYYAMRYVKGETLKEAIDAFHRANAATKRQSAERTVGLRKLLSRFVAVCEAIHYAHSRGVIHRDLKPSNILLGPCGETLVVDWGLARLVGRPDIASTGEETLKPELGSGSTETRTGAAIGTPAYMSPEQAAGQLDEVGPRSDIFGLGATLYALLTGRAPIQQSGFLDALRQAQRGEILPPRKVNRRVPKPLEAIVLKAMAFAPADRYASAQALAGDLERWLADEPVSALREGILSRTARWQRKHPGWVAAIVAMILPAIVIPMASLQMFLEDRVNRRSSRDLAEMKKEVQEFRRQGSIGIALALRRPDDAARGALELARFGASDPNSLYDVARYFSLCVPMAENQMQAEYYADQATRFLGRAVAFGWSKAEETAQDPSFIPLHGRDEFRRILGVLFDRAFPKDPFAK
jgi:serine/threonine-protein kinase